MSTLSELVNFKNKLSTIVSELEQSAEINNKISIVNNLKDDSIITYDNNLNNIISEYQNLIKSNFEIVNIVKNLILLIDKDIDAAATQISLSVEYTQAFNLNTTPMDNFIKLSNKEVLNIVKTKIHSYCDWHYPSLNIYPSSKEWIDCMITSDPLYLLSNSISIMGDPNVSQLIINSAVSEYAEIYQRRLRIYPGINLDFSQLPKNQFGFVLCWSVANYLPMADIERLIKETFNLLRPGGVFMISYNNCELRESAKLVEHLSMSYSTAEKIKNVCLSTGYEIVNMKDLNTQNGFYEYISWAEIRKPGKLTTIKAHQVIGKVNEK